MEEKATQRTKLNEDIMRVVHNNCACMKSGEAYVDLKTLQTILDNALICIDYPSDS